MSGAIKINGTSSGSTTITAPASGGDESIELSTALAAKGDVAGETWTGTHDFSGATVAGIPSGLELISAVSASGYAAISLNNVFSSTYINYRIVWQLLGSTTASLRFRYRASGTDESSATYQNRGYLAGASTGNVNTTTTYFEFVQATSGQWNVLTADLFFPYIGTAKSMVGICRQQDYVTFRGNYHNSGLSFDGFTVYPDTGTLTGDVWVYGYKN